MFLADSPASSWRVLEKLQYMRHFSLFLGWGLKKRRWPNDSAWPSQPRSCAWNKSVTTKPFVIQPLRTGQNTSFCTVQKKDSKSMVCVIIKHPRKILTPVLQMSSNVQMLSLVLKWTVEICVFKGPSTSLKLVMLKLFLTFMNHPHPHMKTLHWRGLNLHSKHVEGCHLIMYKFTSRHS